MKTPLFDIYLTVDWSAANSPKQGKDSIWIAEARRRKRKIDITYLENPATRERAIAALTDLIRKGMNSGGRVFAGFDFPFGYPAGATGKITGAPGWRALWAALNEKIEDSERNASNRFEVAARFNQAKFKSPVYWGRPHQREYEGLSARKAPSPMREAFEYRIVEKRQRPAKSVWQIYGNGAVGGQVLVGLPRLEDLRKTFHDNVQVWPFETNFAENIHAPVVIAEIYPSMFPVAPGAGEVKDCAQVRTGAQTFAAADAAGELRQWLSAPPDIDDIARRAILKEEGWIVGSGWVKS